MDERERRVGLNESVFREVNERLRSLSQGFTAPTEQIDLICECSETACAAHVGMRPDEYEAVRAHATRFVVAPGHVLADDVERVVERHEGYEVVEKLGGSARTAEQTDPRNRDD